MTRLIPLAAVLTLAACAQNIQQAITLDQNAMACHAAVKAATSAANSQANVLNGSRVLVLDPACAAVTRASADLIASAVNARAKVVPGPVSAPAGK